MNAPVRPPKPAYPRFMGLPRIPAMATLQAFEQWVAWDYVWKPEKQKYDKPPLNPRTGSFASHSDRATWSSYDDAVAKAKADGLPGVGFVLGLDDGLTGIDLDDCRDDASGVLMPWAADIVGLAETYAEASPSGQGVRLFALGKVEQATKFDPAKVEIYGKQRYLTITGRHINGTPIAIQPAPKTIGALLARVRTFREQAASATAARGQHSGPAQRPGKIAEALRDPFFRSVNTAALEALSSWVPALFGPAAKYQSGTQGYRVSSAALGRDLEEDLSMTPQGIKDWGVWDMGDARDGRRSPIDLVIEFGGQATAAEAAQWLCHQLGVDPQALGWRGNNHREGRRASDGSDGDQQGNEQDCLPVIRIVAGELPTVVDQAEEALLRSGRPIFVRAGELVRPVTDSVPAAKGKMTTVAKLKSLCPDSTVDLLGQTALYERFDARKGAWVRTDPPAKIASVLLVRDGSWRLPKVAGVVTTPTLRPDGTLLSTPGYDPATRLYLAPDDQLILPPLSDEPSREDAHAALHLLLNLTASFPFVTNLDCAVALSAVLTAVLRGAMSVAPLHAIRAHTPGTGKSLLVDVASTIATGRPCPVIAAGKSEEETEKRLGALLREAVPVVSLDNVNGALAADLLCQITERPLVRMRILGRSETPEFESRATVFATGNNLSLAGDMVRRTVICRLDAGLERPELRRFPFDPIDLILQGRGKYVAAAITIARAYRYAGRPEVCPPIGSFGHWTEMVRAPLIWLGQADPVESMEAARLEDPELNLIRELIGHWSSHIGYGVASTTNRIIQIACARDHVGEFTLAEFRDFLLRVAGEGGAVNSRRLGRWLSAVSGRIVDGCRFAMKADSSHGSRFTLMADQEGTRMGV